MPELILLGTSASIPSASHENTHMAIVDSGGAIMIDCVSSPAVRLSKAGIGLDQVNDLVLTHFHPDHVSGVPLLLMNMWLSGRRNALRVYGLHHCLKRVEDVMAFYEWENWPDFFPVAFHRLPEREDVKLIDDGETKVFSSPVKHLIPTLGLRFEGKDKRQAIAYSCDTEPCTEVVSLAQGCRTLIHEATGAVPGHSSAEQAGRIAQQAGVQQLLLIHYSPDDDLAGLTAAANAVFDGEVALAQDFQHLQF